MHPDLKMQMLYSDDRLKIELNDDLKYIYVEWQRNVTSDEFRKLFTHAANIALDQQCLYWLSDARQIHFIDFADQNWMLREMGPLLQTSSLVKFARISNKESMSLLDVHRIYSELENSSRFKIKTELQVFLEKDDAIDWLFENLELEQK